MSRTIDHQTSETGNNAVTFPVFLFGGRIFEAWLTSKPGDVERPRRRQDCAFVGTERCAFKPSAIRKKPAALHFASRRRFSP